MRILNIFKKKNNNKIMTKIYLKYNKSKILNKCPK